MPPIGSIESLLREWTRWHQTRQLVVHSTKLECERLVAELRGVTRDSDPRLARALRLVDDLERAARAIRPTPPELRKLRLRTEELRQGMRL